MEAVKIVFNGAGASAIAVTKLLIQSGAQNITVCDTTGIIYQGRSRGMNPIKEELAAITNPDRQQGTPADALRGADIFSGLGGPDVLSQDMVRSMAPDPIVFALANPVPEIHPDAARQAG